MYRVRVNVLHKVQSLNLSHNFRSLEEPLTGVIISLYQMIMILLLPLLLMSSFYYRVITVLWRSNKNMTDLVSTMTERLWKFPHLWGVGGVKTCHISTLLLRWYEINLSTGLRIGWDSDPINKFAFTSYINNKDLQLFRCGDKENISMEMRTLRSLNITEEPTRRESQDDIQLCQTNQKTIIQQDKTTKITESRRKLIKMLVVIMIVFTTCWSPRYFLSDSIPEEIGFVGSSLKSSDGFLNFSDTRSQHSTCITAPRFPDSSPPSMSCWTPSSTCKSYISSLSFSMILFKFHVRQCDEVSDVEYQEKELVIS